jgi:TfoX/Sxy family transcriptional regulator of competence genes
MIAYDEQLAERIRELIAGEYDVAEKRMFGGLAFLIGGHIAIAVSSRGGLMARVDPAETEQLLAAAGVGPFEMRGRELDGWLRVDESAVADDAELRQWIVRGVDFARTLPPKD